MICILNVVSFVSFFVSSVNSAQINIDPSMKYQIIDGFGGSNAFNHESGPMTDSEIKLLFDPVDGIGLTLLRTQVPHNGACFNVSEECVGLNTIVDINNVKKYPVKIWASPWSPPKSLKNMGYLMRKNYQQYADYLNRYEQSVKLATGTQLYAVSIQNEPNARVKWATSMWTEDQFYIFFKVLRVTLSKYTRIIMPEKASWEGLLTFNRAKLIKNADIIAFHNYDAKTPRRHGYQFAGKTLWQTEVCGILRFKTNEWDPSIKDALKWATNIHTWLVNGNLNAWHWWWLTGRPNARILSNQYLINERGSVAKRLYALGHYSKFVRPGFTRINAGINSKRMLVSAYSSEYKIVIIVINPFNININIDSVVGIDSKLGIDLDKSDVWVTSKDFNLVNIKFNGYVLAQSITTFEVKI